MPAIVTILPIQAIIILTQRNSINQSLLMSSVTIKFYPTKQSGQVRFELPEFLNP